MHFRDSVKHLTDNCSQHVLVFKKHIKLIKLKYYCFSSVKTSRRFQEFLYCPIIKLVQSLMVMVKIQACLYYTSNFIKMVIYREIVKKKKEKHSDNLILMNKLDYQIRGQVFKYLTHMLCWSTSYLVFTVFVIKVILGGFLQLFLTFGSNYFQGNFQHYEN